MSDFCTFIDIGRKSWASKSILNKSRLKYKFKLKNSFDTLYEEMDG